MKSDEGTALHKVLVARGVSPSGHGIVQMDDGTLRAITKCCGVLFDVEDDCEKCGTNYTDEAKSRETNFYFHARAMDYVNPERHIEEWVRATLGDPDAQMKVRS